MIGPAPSLQQAAWLVDQVRPDGVLLNYMLGRFPSTALAKRLAELAIPLVLVTGFPRDVLLRGSRASTSIETDRLID